MPREVRAGSLLDRLAQLVILYLRQGFPELGGKRRRWRDLAVRAPLRRAIDVIRRPYAEAELVDREAALFEAKDELRREHLELVRPNARGDLHDEDAALERDGLRALGDSGPDGGAPHRDGNGGLVPREAVLARALEDAHERLRRVELLAGPSSRHGETMLASNPR